MFAGKGGNGVAAKTARFAAKSNFRCPRIGRRLAPSPDHFARREKPGPLGIQYDEDTYFYQYLLLLFS